MSSSINIKHRESFDIRMIAQMRLVLAASGLLIIYIDPSEPARFIVITYTLLVLYLVFSTTILILALFNNPILRSFNLWAHWVDVGWYAVLIALTSGTNSIFFFGFFFAILGASFGMGFSTGIKVTVTSILLFLIFSLIADPGGVGIELNRLLLRPTFLLILGYMISYRGGYEIRLRRRQTFLKDISRLSNPRLGSDRMVGLMIEKIRSFYKAESSILVIYDPTSSNYRLHRAVADNPEMAVRAELLSDELSQQLLGPPGDKIVVYSSDRRQTWQRWRSNYYTDELTPVAVESDQENDVKRLATLLDTGYLISVPVRSHNESIGRFFLTSRSVFDISDAEFLLQVIEQIIPILENIRLVDRLASEAAEEERERIAGDIHDSVIQPYIGLQIGLVSLKNKIASNHTSALSDATKLIEMTDSGINELRIYTATLRDARVREGGLPAAVRRFTARFTEVTGTDVTVSTETEIHIPDRLAAEVFQMIAEGLSNVRRHTNSKSVEINMDLNDENFTLVIKNDNPDDAHSPHSFSPRSIVRRVESLDGRVSIQHQNGSTLVIITIPM